MDLSPKAKAPIARPFITGGGEMGERTRSFDWAQTPLGPIDHWPQSLKIAVRIMLDSRYAMWLGWGPDFIFFYNDAYARMTLGSKHPWALGRSAREVWSEIWGDIGPRAESVVQTGEATWDEGLRLFLERHGYTEETYHTFSYSPLPDDAGDIGGMLCVVTEDTNRTIGERRLRTLRELAARTTDQTKSVEEACQSAVRTLAENTYDLSFVLIYLLDADSKSARLAGASGLTAGSPWAPNEINVVERKNEENATWPLSNVLHAGHAEIVTDLRARGADLPGGAWPESTHQAVVLPITKSGLARLAGFIVAGVSPRLDLNDDYMGFFDLLTSQVATTITNARAYEEERQRVEALSELDKTKTAFFSNVSHEFRTPLTLMLGPVEDLLAKSHTDLPPAAARQLEIVNRNGLRLLRLVNTLLDFSRIEAGRVRAVFQPTELALYSAELASVFRSACERAGLELNVDCQSIDQPVFIDRDMWEKIILNLLSNAFKFTFSGHIDVRLRQVGEAAELTVEDTGTGIPPEEMPRLFERFHRVQNARGRTHEGSGIGLALVQELVKLHGGSIAAESGIGKGTSFIVTIPLGSAHLPADQLADRHRQTSTVAGAMPYVEEALRWLPDESRRQDDDQSELPAYRETIPVGHLPWKDDNDDDRPRILVADDNADMRQYVVRLLAENFRVDAVADGEAALDIARSNPPDLVLSDVMMPNLDGFQLLQALRLDPRTHAIPVIMLSARAGEESRVEGMEAGADDYLVKPFSSRELLARVTAHLQMARMRRESSESLRQSEERLRMALTAARMVAWQFDPTTGHVAVSGDASDLLGLPSDSKLEKSEQGWALLHPEDLERHRAVAGKAVEDKSSYVSQYRIIRPDNGKIQWMEERGHAVQESAGQQVRLVGVVMNITEQRQAEERERKLLAETAAADAKFRAFFDQGALFAGIMDVDGTIIEPNRLSWEGCGYTREQIIGKPFWDGPWWTPRQDLVEKISAACQQAAAGQTFREELPFFVADGSERVADVIIQPIKDESGRVVFLAPTGTDITERKRAEEELSLRRQQFQRIAEATPDILFVYNIKEGRNVYVNRSIDYLLGYDSELIKGKSEEAFDAIVHPDDLISIADAKERRSRLVEGESLEHEYRIRDARGDYHLFRNREVIFSRTADGSPREILGLAQDITAQRANENAIKESQRFLRSSLDALQSHIAVIDSAGDILEVNEAWRRFAQQNDFSGSGYGIHDNYLTVCENGVDECGDGPNIAHGIREVIAGRLDRFMVEYPCHSKTEHRWFLMQATRFQSPGPVRVVVAHENVTDRKHAEDALREADRRKDEFLATLAHELRNPLAPIRNGVQLIRMAGDDRSIIEQANTMMDRQLTQMVRLIDDLLDVSRITSNKLELRRERVDLASIIQQAVEATQPLINTSRHELTTSLPAKAIYLDADTVRLTQVFGNLLTNACKYTEPGGKIALTVVREERDIAISIRDTGVGIPTEKLQHVFEMFAQIHQSIERSQGGLGIGLTLVRRLVEMHGGSVSAFSEGIDRGSEFIVRLPMIADEMRNTSLQSNSKEMARMPARRILVVDDNRDSALSLALLLKVAGNETFTANDGLEAVEAAERLLPDVILLDIGLPRLNGYEAARRIREQAWGEKIVLIALTGWGQEEDRRKSNEAGFNSHLVKPVDHAVLSKLLVELVPQSA